MIKLENISSKAIDQNRLKSFRNCCYEEYQKLLCASNLEEVQRLLKEMKTTINNNKIKGIDNQNLELFYSKLQQKFNKAFNQVQIADLKGDPLQIYTIKDYDNPQLNRQNMLNKGNALLLNNPFTANELTRYSNIKYSPIQQIKEALSYAMPSGQNFISANPQNYECYKKIGNSSLPKLATAIEMFQEQIIRQSKLTNNLDQNLFYLNYQDKTQLLSDRVFHKEIEEYFNENIGNEFICGKIIGYYKCNNRLLDTYLAKYTTLEELENLKNSLDFTFLDNRFKVKKLVNNNNSSV